MSKQTVIGVFATKDQAQSAVQALQTAGYDSASIDFMSNDSFSDASMRAKHEESHKGFFASLFSDDDDYDYKNLHDTARRGNVVTVHTNDMTSAERAADILDEYGAINSDEASTSLRAKGVDYTDNEQTLDVIKEDIAVGKQTVATGGVRVRSRVIARPVEETVRLRQETAFVTRTPVDQVVSPDAIDAFQEQTIAVTETAERAVVQKTARVVEQVSVGTQATENVETIQETVRETDVEVERVAAADATIGTATSATANTLGQKVDAAGNAVHNALDRDNDGELVDLNDRDGRIG